MIPWTFCVCGAHIHMLLTCQFPLLAEPSQQLVDVCKTDSLQHIKRQEPKTPKERKQGIFLTQPKKQNKTNVLVQTGSKEELRSLNLILSIVYIIK